MAFFKKKAEVFTSQKAISNHEPRTYNTANQEVSALVGRNSDDTKIIDVSFENGDEVSYVISRSALKIILAQGQWFSLEDRLILEGSSPADAKRIAQLEQMNLWKEFHDVLIQETGEDRAYLYFEHLIERQMRDLEEQKVNSVSTDFIVDDIEEIVSFWLRPSIPAHDLPQIIEELCRQESALLRAIVGDKNQDEVKFEYVSSSGDPVDVFIDTIFSTMEQSSMTLEEILHHTSTAYPQYFVLKRIIEMRDNGYLVHVEDDDSEDLPDFVIEENENESIATEEESQETEAVDRKRNEVDSTTDFFISTESERGIEESLTFPTNSLRSVREDYHDEKDDPLVTSHEWGDILALEQQIRDLEDDLVAKSEVYMESMSDHIYNTQIHPNNGGDEGANYFRDGISHLFFEIESIEKKRDELNLHRRAMLERAVSVEDNSIAVAKRIQDIEGISHVALRTDEEDKEVLSEASPEVIFDINEYNEKNVPIFYKISQMMDLDPFKGVYQ